MVAGYNGDRPLKTGPFDYAQGSYVSAAQGSCNNGDRPLGSVAGSVYFDRLSNRVVEPSACDNGDRPLHFNLQKSFCIL